MQQTGHKTRIYIHSQTMLFNVSFWAEFKPKWRVPRSLFHPYSRKSHLNSNLLKYTNVIFYSEFRTIFQTKILRILTSGDLVRFQNEHRKCWNQRASIWPTFWGLVFQIWHNLTFFRISNLRWPQMTLKVIFWKAHA